MLSRGTCPPHGRWWVLLKKFDAENELTLGPGAGQASDCRNADAGEHDQEPDADAGGLSATKRWSMKPHVKAAVERF